MLGDAKQKLQRMIDLAEDLYANVNDLKDRVEDITNSVEDTTATVEETNERVSELASEVRAQRVILEALAEEHGLDVERPDEFVPGGEASPDAEGDASDAAASSAHGTAEPSESG